MSQLRLNVLDGNWIVLAPERGKKPESFKVDRGRDIRDLPEYEEKCPFCVGNEDRFGIVPLREIKRENGEWTTRLIENKYKIFDDYADCPVRPEPFTQEGVHFSYKGCGNHYLVLENPVHNRVLGMSSDKEIGNVFLLYQEAFTRLSHNPNNLIGIAFKNQGLVAGASQPHAHSQIVGSRVVPAWIRNAMRVQQQYFDQHGMCALCAVLDYELQQGTRVITETEHLAVLSPYAPSAPYEAWVVPKRHYACYSEVQDSDIAGLAAGVRIVLNAYVEKLNNPDFNYHLHSSPFPMAKVPFYHFFIRIVPRLWNNGGFETGTGMSVISTMPEVAAELLRTNSNS